MCIKDDINKVLTCMTSKYMLTLSFISASVSRPYYSHSFCTVCIHLMTVIFILMFNIIDEITYPCQTVAAAMDKNVLM